MTNDDPMEKLEQLWNRAMELMYDFQFKMREWDLVQEASSRMVDEGCPNYYSWD